MNKKVDDIFIIKNEEDIKDDVEKLFEYYRKTGFPNYDKEQYNGKKILSHLINYDEKTILNGKDLQQSMYGCGFLWTYFPHWIDVCCGDDKSLSEKWNDDELLYNLIYKTYRWQQKYGNGIFTTNRIRQNAKVYMCKQSVSNFRPTVAKYIYNTYGNNGSVWDMSCGYGGRLLGFLSSNCKIYYGTEPATKTYNGLCRLKEDLCPSDKKVILLNRGSEIKPPVKNSLDLCFTSPPYFNTEKYSEEETQSYIKFPTKDLWLDGFMKKTILNCYESLKKNGKMILNVADVKSLPTMEEDVINIATNNGFALIDTLYLILSSIAGKGVKREPVFIFEKI